MQTWEQANKWESAWWGACLNTVSEEIKQTTYNRLMGLTPYSYNLKGKSVIDIGGGPVSLLLKYQNRGMCTVVDPLVVPDWVQMRYEENDIEFLNFKAENVDIDLLGRTYDEATVGYSTNTWEHGVGVFTNANSRTVYFNGGNSATNTDSGGVTGADRTAIARTADATPFGVGFATSIAEVGIWNRALVASEITALAAGYAPSYFKNGLVAYYPLIGKVDPETDLKGGVNLTSTGASVSAHPKIIYPH